MRTRFTVSRAITRIGIVLCLTLSAMLTAVSPARAQYVQIQAVEVTPFIGVRFGGTFEIQPEGAAQIQASFRDAQSTGLSGGVRFNDLSLVEIRWTQSISSLRFGFPFGSAGQLLGDVSLNQFHADFTQEWDIHEVKGLRSYLTGSVGATYISATNESFTRFSFGLSAGLKQFIGSHLAIRAEAGWLPIWVAPEVGGFACGAINFGGCFVVLNGTLMQQYEMSIGPVIRF